MSKWLLFLALAVALVSASSAASSPGFAAQAHLQPSACVQTMAGTIVKITGCVADAVMTGTLPGRLTLSYGAKVDIARGGGSQQGRLTLTSTSGKGRLVARFSGVVSIGSGVSRGRWTAIERHGAFGHLAGQGGTYVSRTADQGIHVTFDVRG
jgi:hypothetical protein